MLGFYEPVDIHFSQTQIVWVLKNCLEGWPAQESGYKDDISSASINPHAPGESEMLVIAEITARLELCYDAGEKFYNAFLRDKTIDATGLCPMAVQPRPKRDCPMAFDCPQQGRPGWKCDSRAVLGYISGVCRKIQSCDRCLSAIREIPKEHISKVCKRWGRKSCTFAMWISNHR